MRYQSILMSRIEDEERQLKEQALLSEEAGIIQSTDDIVVTKKTFSDYVHQAGNIIFSGGFLTLIFIGILDILNPASREILLSMLPF